LGNPIWTGTSPNDGIRPRRPTSMMRWIYIFWCGRPAAFPSRRPPFGLAPARI